MDFDFITNSINNAVEESVLKGIKGKETTPFLLAKVKEITQGKSLISNIELVYSNARLASEIAIELVKL